ncbi:DUF2007 domain-containing protein [bacterium]|nr:DUF2007 domain-containing protein [bacterium]
MATQTLFRLIGVAHEYEAALIQAALEDQGIECSVVGGAIGDFRAECPGLIEVFVAEADADTAREIVASVETAGDDIDWETVDVGESESDTDSGDETPPILSGFASPTMVTGFVILAAVLVYLGLLN